MITSFKVYSDDADETRVLCADNLDKVLEILENNGYIVEVKRHTGSVQYEDYYKNMVRFIVNELDTRELLKLKSIIEDRIADRKDGGYND